MPRTIYTTEDIMNITENLFMAQTEDIIFKDEITGEEETKDLWEYLNVEFYTWKQRLVEKDGSWLTFDNFVQQMESLDEATCLVELVDDETLASQDIDSTTKTVRLTFLVQTNKIKNLDYLVNKVRNAYMGNPQTLSNAFGIELKTYINMGILIYETEPMTIQTGECLQASVGLKFSYINDALTWQDQEIAISLTDDDTYDDTVAIVPTAADLTLVDPTLLFSGAIVGVRIDETQEEQSTKYTWNIDTVSFDFLGIVASLPEKSGDPITDNYMEMPLTKATMQAIFTSNPLPTAQRPDLTGMCAVSLTNAITLTFFDFNRILTMKFNDLFWFMGAYRVDNRLATRRDVNVPAWLRIKSNGHIYVYKMMIDNMQKVLANSDANISSVTLKTWGKITSVPIPPVLS